MESPSSLVKKKKKKTKPFLYSINQNSPNYQKRPLVLTTLYVWSFLPAKIVHIRKAPLWR